VPFVVKNITTENTEIHGEIQTKLTVLLLALRGEEYYHREHRGSQRNTNKVLSASPCPPW